MLSQFLNTNTMPAENRPCIFGFSTAKPILHIALLFPPCSPLPSSHALAVQMDLETHCL